MILVQSYRERLLSGIDGFLVRLALGAEDVRRRQVVFDLVKSSQHGLPADATVALHGVRAWLKLEMRQVVGDRERSALSPQNPNANAILILG